MIFVSNNHSNIKQPLVLTLAKTHLNEVTVEFSSDLVFKSRKYQIPAKVKHSQDSSTLELSLAFMKEEAESNDQILNNFGMLSIKQLQWRMSMILTTEKDCIYVTLITNKK